MAHFVIGDDRSQSTLFPERLDDYLGEDNPVRAIDVFVGELDLAKLGFDGVEPEATGRPAYHPATLLKIYVYGYLNRVQSSRRLERECQRNIELVWLTGHLMPDFKTIADFRKDNGDAIRKVCREFVVLCRRLELFSEASVAIDGSKFKAVNTRDRNFTQAKMVRRLAQIDESIARFGGYDERACLPLGEGGEGGVDLAFGAGLQDMELHPLRLCRFLHVSHHVLDKRNVRVHEQGDHLGLGNQLGKQLKPLWVQIGSEEADARGARLATRPSPTGSTLVRKTIGIVDVATGSAARSRSGSLFRPLRHAIPTISRHAN